MSTKTGTATNYFDLLTTLKDFLTVQGHAFGLAFTGTGTGRLTGAIGTSTSVVEVITCTATSATSFTVVGSVTGSLGTATVGSLFTSSKCAFTITAGGTAFVAGDVFTFNLSPKWTLLRWGGCGDGNYSASVSGAAAMFDSNVATNAINTTSASLPFQVSVQMQAATEVKAFSVWCGDTSTHTPTTYSLEYSDNGSSWTVAQTFTGLSWSAGHQRKDHTLSTSAGSHLYWRLNVTAGAATIKLDELRMYADANFKWACSNSFQFAFRGPGLDGTQQIHALGQLGVSSGSGYWNIGFSGSRFWTDQELDVTAIPTVSSQHWHCLVNTSIQYWMVANGQRFILMTRVSGVYELSYVGFGLPYETPTNHPHPLMIGAPAVSSSTVYSLSTSGSYRNPWDPGLSGTAVGLEVMIPSGVFRGVANRSDSGAGTEGSGASATYGKTSPYSTDSTGSQTVAALIRDSIDGTRPFLPLSIFLPSDTHYWGEFDGIAWVSGYGNAAESLTQIGAIDYISFPNVFRSSVNHFAAIALD